MVGNPISPVGGAVVVRACPGSIFDIATASPEANQRMCDGKVNGRQYGCPVRSRSELVFAGPFLFALADLLRLTRYESVEGLFVRFLL